MRHVECRFEEDVLSAVVQSRWPERVDPQLQAHVEGCGICSDIVAVAGTLDADHDEMLSAAVIPEAGRIWWQAQLRARREAAEAASAPITWAQVAAFASAMGLIGACFGASSTWFQAALGSIKSGVSKFELAAFVSSVAAAVGHAAFALGLVLIVLLVPTALYIALGRD